ncbi:uncharacterized protein V1518DRAFT_320459 [Limtongia smithiae]|uniref:uncharacterized protein n=1 Tax=Limtongia smithiae TaxID=1125753 RepID=UPI0034CDEC46
MERRHHDRVHLESPASPNANGPLSTTIGPLVVHGLCLHALKRTSAKTAMNQTNEDRATRARASWVLRVFNPKAHGTATAFPTGDTDDSANSYDSGACAGLLAGMEISIGAVDALLELDKFLGHLDTLWHVTAGWKRRTRWGKIQIMRRAATLVLKERRENHTNAAAAGDDDNEEYSEYEVYGTDIDELTEDDESRDTTLAAESAPHSLTSSTSSAGSDRVNRSDNSGGPIGLDVKPDQASERRRLEGDRAAVSLFDAVADGTSFMSHVPLLLMCDQQSSNIPSNRSRSEGGGLGVEAVRDATREEDCECTCGAWS